MTNEAKMSVRLYASLADLRAAALAHLRDDAIRTGLLMEQIGRAHV